MAKSPRNSKRRPGRPNKPGCSACKKRNLKCDETLPICQLCESNGRVCKGLLGKASAVPQALASNNTSPLGANMRAMAANASAEAQSPIVSSDPEKLQCIVLIEGPKTGTGQGHMPAVGANTKNTQSPEKDQGLILAEEPEGSKHTHIGKRKADGAPLLGYTSSKRAQSYNNEQEARKSIFVPSEGEDSSSVSVSTASKHASQADAFTSPRRSSNIARMALLAVDAQSTNIVEHGSAESSQNNTRCDSVTEPNCPSVYTPSIDDESGQLPSTEHSMTQNNNHPDFTPLHTVNQTSTKGINDRSQSEGSSIDDNPRQSFANHHSMETDNHRSRLNEQDTHFTPESDQSMAITFTDDNRVQSLLPLATIQSRVQIFSRNCAVLLPDGRICPIDVITWQHAADFYSWHLEQTGIAKVVPLTFELLDAKRKLQKALVIPGGSLFHFQALKQWIWDSFWDSFGKASKLEKETLSFEVLIKPAPRLDGEAVPRSPTRRFTTSKPGNTQVAIKPQVHDGLPRPHEEPRAHRTRLPPIQEVVGSSDHSTSSSVGSAVPAQHGPRHPPRIQPSNNLRTAISSFPEISLRLQTNGAGKVSSLHCGWALRPGATTTQFFAWFASQTGRGGGEGPPLLKFTFKDAMPTPTSSYIARGDEDCFNLMRRNLKSQFETAKEYVPGLKEFVVLVRDPGWVLEEDDW